MASFRLEKKSSNRVKTVFHVVNDSGDICGSINVAPSEESDLLKHWAGAKDQRQPQAQAQSQNPFVEALMRAKSKVTNRQAVLRGCL
jgi:hypothetical protein